MPRRTVASTRSASTARSARPAPPLSLTRRWDKAKWHADASDFPKALPRSAAARHIVAALRFLDERGQLTASGKAELRDGASEETALLVEHVRPSARAFLDEAYDPYLAASDYGKPPPVTRLEKAWDAFVLRFDVTKAPKKTPYQALLLKHSDHTPELHAVLRSARANPELLTTLREVLAQMPRNERRRVSALLELDAALSKGDLGGVEAHPAPATLLDVAGYVSSARPRLLEAVAVLAKRTTKKPTGLRRVDKAVANAVNRRPRADWLRLAPGDRKRLRDSIHRTLAHDPHLALCALRTAADATSLRLVERCGTFPKEGTIETYRGTKRGVVLAKVERAYDELRREIARVARASAKAR